MTPRRSVVLAVLFAISAAVSGCAAEEASAPVKVVLVSGSPLADSPSSFIARITATSGDQEVLASATKAVRVAGHPLVLLEDALPPGNYRLTAAQQGCAMNGQDCPDDPSSSAFGVADWQCSVGFEARKEQVVRIEVEEGLDANGSCRLVP